MTKTINFELSKKLNDLWLLDRINTEHYLMENIFWDYVLWTEINQSTFYPKWKKYKTLTLEEAIEFLVNKWSRLWIMMYEYPKIKWVWKNIVNPFDVISYISDIKNIEKMIEYLIDNNLLTK